MQWKPLYKGSKNPPLDTQILLKANDGSVGIGIAFKHNKLLYIDYTSMSPTRGWYGEKKDSFKFWAMID